MRKGARFGALVGPLLVVLALSKVHAAWVADPPYDYTGSFRFAWSIAYAVALIVAAYGLGLPDAPRRWGQAATAAVGSSVAAAIMISLSQLVLGDALLPRFVVLTSAVAVVPLHVAFWAMSHVGRGRAESRDRVVVVTGAEDGAVLEADLAMSPERPVVLAERIDTADACQDPVVVAGVDGPLLQSVLRSKATVVVIGRGALANETVVAQAAALHEAGVRVRTLLQFYEEWLGKLPVGELERASLFFDISELHRVRYGRVKRMVDVAGALVGLIPLVLSLPFVLVGNLMGNRGPLLYKQKRVGRGGHEFEILKFRTMVQPADAATSGTEWTARNDPRITRFGGVLRTTHLDELPQMVNILRGDLSLVGPRPEQPHYVVDLSEKLPFYGMRHLVRPGLTGWAQVKYGYAGDERDALEKLQYEFFYLRHQSLRFDARVLARTIRSVTGGQGAGR